MKMVYNNFIKHFNQKMNNNWIKYIKMLREYYQIIIWWKIWNIDVYY